MRQGINLLVNTLLEEIYKESRGVYEKNIRSTCTNASENAN